MAFIIKGCQWLWFAFLLRSESRKAGFPFSVPRTTPVMPPRTHDRFSTTRQVSESFRSSSVRMLLISSSVWSATFCMCVTLPISVRSFCLIRASIFVGFIVAFITLSFNGWILWGMGNRTPTQKPLPRVSFHTVRPSLDAFRAVTLDFLLSGDILVFTDKVKEHDKLAA